MNDIIDGILRDVCELPDRTSPEDQPDMMLVSEGELRDILRRHLEAEIARLRTALSRLLELCINANEGAFENGVTDSTGTIDEGNVRAGEIIDDARKALENTDMPTTVRWCLDEARKLLTEDPPRVFEAITHIDAAIACDTQRI